MRGAAKMNRKLQSVACIAGLALASVAAFAGQDPEQSTTIVVAQAPVAAAKAPRASAQKITITGNAEGGDPWVLLQGSGSYLGVDLADVNKERVSALRLRDEHGAEVTALDQDAPAAKAGLKEHDVILEFNGQRVEGQEQLRRMIRETPPGRTVTLGISRERQSQQIKVELGDRAKMSLNKVGAWSMADPS